MVCDGAGGAAHSEIGSWLASTTFVELVEVHFESGGRLVDIGRDKVVGWIAKTAERLTARAHDDGNSPKDYSCTLIAAIVGNDAAAFAQIADGAIVVSHGEADGWSWVFWPQHGEYANQTVFVLSANAADAMEFNLAPRRIREFAIFSDGIERMVLHGPTKAVNDPFFDQMWALCWRVKTHNPLIYGRVLFAFGRTLIWNNTFRRLHEGEGCLLNPANDSAWAAIIMLGTNDCPGLTTAKLGSCRNGSIYKSRSEKFVNSDKAF